MLDDFFAKAHELEQAGKPFATATVVRIERPTSGKPGDRAIITQDGELWGWIGGSCSRPTVLEQARAALADGQPRLVRLAQAPDEARREGMTDLAMTCFSGGTMEIYIEPQTPRPRLVVVGTEALARALAALAKVLGYRVVGVDTGEGSLPEATETLPDVRALAAESHPLSFVVVATHGEHDEVAVEEALRSTAPYVGLVASRKRAASIIDYLEHRDIGAAQLERFHSPAGLDFGARRPEEIALSILAEIVEVRRRLDHLAWEAAGQPTAATASEQAPEERPEEAPAETAIDPICGMTVQVAGAQNTFDYQGTTYYFCCGGCRARFAKDPEAALAQGA